MEEAGKLAESTAILLNVSEFEDATSASQALISTMQAFQYTAYESQHVVDILNEVGNNYAVSSDGLAIALQDSASALMEAGNSLEQSVALVAAANKVVQDPNSVGSALRTISLRLRGTSVEVLEELGEETDGAVESVSKMQKKLEALTGVDILTNSGAYKDTYTILKEIAEVWDDMNSMDQAAALELMAGKNRANTLAAILNNVDDLKDAYDSALNAEGSALKENETYLDSIQGHVDVLTNSYQTMWMNFINSDVIKFFVDLANVVVTAIDKFGAFETILAGILTYFNLSSSNSFDLASWLGIHDIEDGWFQGFGKDGFFGKLFTLPEIKIPKSSKTGLKDLQKELTNIEYQLIPGDEFSITPDTKEYEKALERRKELIRQIRELGVEPTINEQFDKIDNNKLIQDRIEKLQGDLDRKNSLLGDFSDKNNDADKKLELECDELRKQIADLKSRLANAQSKPTASQPKQDNSTQIKNETDAYRSLLAVLQETQGVKLSIGDVEGGYITGQIDKINSLKENQTDLWDHMSNLDVGDSPYKDANTALKAYVASVKDGQYSVAGFNEFLQQHNAGIKASGKASIAAALGHQVLNAALSMGVSLLASFIIGGVLKFFDNLIHKTEELTEAANEAVNAYKDSQSTLREHRKTVNELSNAYNDLSSGVNVETNENISLSSSSYQKYLDVCNDIAEMYPHLVTGFDAQGNAILSLKGNVESLTQAFLDEAQASRQALIASSDDIFNAFQANYVNLVDVLDTTTGYKQQIEIAEQFLAAIAKGEAEVQKLYDSYVSFGVLSKDVKNVFDAAGIDYENMRHFEFGEGYVIDFDKFQKASDKFISFVKSTTNTVNSETSNVKSLLDAYLGEDEEYAKMGKKARVIVDSVISSFDADHIAGFGDVDNLWASVEKNIIDILYDNPDLVDEISDMFDIQDVFESGGMAIETYQGKIKGFFNYISSLNLDPAFFSYMQDMFDISDRALLNKTDTAGRNVDAMIKYAESFISSGTEAIKKELVRLGQGGNVDLLNRPIVTGDKSKNLRELYGFDMDDKATVLTHTFSNEDGTVAMNFTPILVDENGEWYGTYTPEALQKYAEEVIAGTREDVLNLKIGATYEGEDAVERAERDARTIHELHDMYYLNGSEIDLSKLTYSDLEAINSKYFNVDGETIVTWEQLMHHIQLAKNAMTEDFTTDNFSDYSEQISGISSSISTYQEALEKLESGNFTIADFMDLIAEFPELAKGVDVSSDSFDGLAINLNKAMKNAPDDLVKELQELREQLVLAGKSTTHIDQLIESVENMPTDAIKSLSGEYVTLTDQINAARVAQNKLQEAMSENPNEGYETRGEAMEKMKELMKEGKIGSESELWSIAEQFFGDNPEAIAAIADKNADALAKLIAARNKWYETDGDGKTTFEGTKNFLNDVESAVAKAKEAGRLTDVIWDYDDKTGRLNFDFNNANWDEIVQILGESEELAGLTSEEFRDLLVQVGQFFDIDWEDADDLLAFIRQLNDGSKSAAEHFDSTTDALKSFLKSEGLSTDLLELDLTVDADKAKFDALSKELQDLLTEYYELKDKFKKDPLSITWQLEKDASTNKNTGLTDDSLAAINQLVSTATDQKTGVTWLSLDELSAAAEEAGMDVDALMDKINELKDAGKIIDLKTTEHDPLGLQGMQKDADSTIVYLEALGIQLNELSGSLTIDVPSFINVMIEAGWGADQIKQYMSTLGSSGYKFTYTTEENKVETLDVHTEEGKAKVDELVKASNELTDTETLTVNLDGTAEAALKRMKSYLDEMTRKPHNIVINETVNRNTSDVNGTANYSGTAHAQGSWGAPKTETALVGELGPEMLVRNGRWTTIGENGAEFRQIKKGDIIFNHKQTQDLLSKGYVIGRGKAYASGTAYADTESVFGSYDIDGDTYTKYDVNNSIAAASGALSKAADALSDSSEKFKEVFDWIEVRLEEINETISLESARLENTIGYDAKNKIVDNLLAINYRLYDNLLAGADTYYEFAKKLLEKVPEEYRQLAKDGTIAIEAFTEEADKETVEAIQNYRDWVQKGADVTQQAEETLTEISALAKQAIDNIAEDFDNKSSLNQNRIDQLEAYNALIETTQGFESTGIYQEIIDATNRNLEQLRNQREQMQAELNAQVEAGNIKKYSQDWYDAVNDIAAVDTEIIELTTDVANYQDAINELHWEKFEAMMGAIEAVAEEAENLIDILSNEDLVDDDGNWTDEGIASLGLYAQQMEAAEVQAKKYQDEIANLNKNWKALGYTETEYLEKLDELKDSQYDAIKSYHDAKDAIVDLNKERVDAIKEGIEKEIEAYEELIEKKKEELDAEKDLYDFQKSIADHQKNIADIERKLAALSSDNSASARAQRAKLEAELAEAQADLQDTYYDRSISDQQDALDQELENFQEAKDQEMEGWDEYLENTNQVVADSLATVQANTETVYNTLLAMGEEYSLSITESLTSPWQEGENAIQSFSERFGISMSATVEELTKLELDFVETMAEIERAGVEAVDTVAENANRYTEAKNPEPDDDEEDSNGDNGGDNSNVGSSTAGLVSSLSGNIKYGQTGSNVKKLQQALNELGYGNAGTIGLDGIFGDSTLAAVKKFQSDMGIASDGIVAQETKNKFKIKGYAKGSSGLDKDQLALLDELGEELVLHAKDGRLSYVTKGTGIVPADLTENLVKWGDIDPSNVLEQNRPKVGVSPSVINNNTEIHIDASVGELIHVEHLDGNDPAEITKVIDKAWDKRMKELNAQIRRRTNR